jgi:hypothetical protein
VDKGKMSKRTAENQLTQDNWQEDDDENDEVKSPFILCFSALVFGQGADRQK